MLIPDRIHVGWPTLFHHLGNIWFFVFAEHGEAIVDEFS